jgi:hypothetical protein
MRFRPASDRGMTASRLANGVPQASRKSRQTVNFVNFVSVPILSVRAV